MSATAWCIVGLGACTPIGRSVWASAAAARAGVCGFSEHPFMVDTAGRPMRVARAPWLQAGVEGLDRYERLLVPAVAEALDPVVESLHERGAAIGLALALPPARPGRPAGLGAHLLQAVAARYGNRFCWRAAFESGHAAGHEALCAASGRRTRQRLDACVVAGVDSYLAPETLEWLEACDQLHGAGPLNNAWGFVPGEAAGAIMLATGQAARECGAAVLGEIPGAGLGREPHRIKTAAVCVGDGLGQAFEAALRAIGPEQPVQDVFCDINGEPYRADEYGFAALRFKERFRAAGEFVAPADCWGDVGAAGAALHTALAVIGARKRYRRAALTLVCASSEDGTRGAALIRAAGSACG